MFKKSLSIVIFGVFILSSLACSLSQCAQKPSTPEEIVSEPQEMTSTEIVPEETQAIIHPGYILYSDTEGLYLLDISNFQSQQVASGRTASGKISPDGQYLAYFELSLDPNNWHYRKLAVIDLNTGELLDVSNTPEDINTFVWSPIPGEITYTQRNWDYCSEFIDRKITGIYQINVLTNETRILHTGTDQYVFWLEEWSPDGRYLLFSHGPDCSEGSSLMYFDSQTSDVSGVPFAEASWSPDGSILAANDIWYWEPEEIPLMKYDISTGESNILYQESGYYVGSPTWSPNGEWIAFTRSSTADYDNVPVLLNQKTGVLINIPLSSATPKFWNPTGDILVLSTTMDDSNKNIFLYQTDTEEISLIFEGLSGYVLQWIKN